ncbi:hypothetical protein D3C75_1032740 [compost metagenome]
MTGRPRLIGQRQVARYAQQRLGGVIKRAGQQQRFRLLDTQSLRKVMQIVVHRQRRGGKNPAARFLCHHLFELIGHGQRRQGEGEMAGVAFVPIAVARLVKLF